MFLKLKKKFHHLLRRLRWPFLRPKPPRVIVKTFSETSAGDGDAAAGSTVRVASFNAALFSMAAAVPRPERPASFDSGEDDNSVDWRPKGILKKNSAKSGLRVSINLPDNEISMKKKRGLGVRSCNGGVGRTVFDVLREVEADVVALQCVRAEEEKDMKPLKDLGEALGLNHLVFAESWAPEFGNAILSKWPIISYNSHKIVNDSDYRNVLKAKIDVPGIGEFDLYCTDLDLLDENWRMKQINAIIQSSNTPHVLAGSLNSLDETDYSLERWAEIVKYYQEIGKPNPKAEVMNHLKKAELYTDAKDFGGECESVVVIAKGQSVQGSCKYGTRVDYILASPDSSFEFVPGSYSVFSSKGTSDHHIVKVDMVKVENNNTELSSKRGSRKSTDSSNKRGSEKRVVKIIDPNSSKGLWKIQT